MAATIRSKCLLAVEICVGFVISAALLSSFILGILFLVRVVLA